MGYYSGPLGGWGCLGGKSSEWHSLRLIQSTPGSNSSSLIYPGREAGKPSEQTPAVH